FRVPAGGGRVLPVTRGERRLTSISRSERGHFMAYAATDAVSPTELYVARGDGTGESRATSFNDGWLDAITLVAPERLTWTVGDSVQIEGWVIQPVNYTPGRKYPLILKIHGGPHSAYGNTFFPTFHALSAAGFFVLLLAGESVADQQQWRFQSAKHAAKDRVEPVDHEFLTTGLFRYSRHPNFFCEQALWWA
ncbi:MAG TPA: DUF1295 domain-containing protein, partial [Gemmatimonadetes bacterium]|nr:DUF1295 domain-containing protein [Gemmatimonadota bacterium]